MLTESEKTNLRDCLIFGVKGLESKDISDAIDDNEINKAVDHISKEVQDNTSINNVLDLKETQDYLIETINNIDESNITDYINSIKNHLNMSYQISEADLTFGNMGDIKRAQDHITQRTIELLNRDEISDEEMKNQEQQLDLVNRSYLENEEKEISAILYYALPLAHSLPILTLIGVGLANLSLVLIPTAVLLYSLTYTYNIYNQGNINSRAATILPILSAFAIATTIIAALPFLGVQLPFSGALMVSIATAINICLFFYSFSLEGDRVSQATNLYNQQLLRLSIALNDPKNSSEKRQELIQKNLEVVLNKYRSLVGTIKAPWSKAKHNKDLRRLRNSIIFSIIFNSGYPPENEEKVQNLREFFKLGISLEEYATNKIVAAIKEAGGVKKNTNLFDLRSTPELNGTLKNMQKFRDIIISRFKNIDEDKIKAAIDIICQEDKFLNYQFFNPDIDSKFDANRLRSIYTYIDKSFDNSLEEDTKNIEQNALIQTIDSNINKMDEKWNKDTLYYVINFCLITANVTLVLGPILGISGIFLSQPLMISMTVGITLVVGFCTYKALLHSSFAEYSTNTIRGLIGAISRPTSQEKEIERKIDPEKSSSIKTIELSGTSPTKPDSQKKEENKQLENESHTSSLSSE